MAEVGILIIDDDVANQRALKNILDSEGWRVRIVPVASHALNELANGSWNLVIANAALTDLRGPIFAILRELAIADSYGTDGASPEETTSSEDGNGAGRSREGHGLDTKSGREVPQPQPRPLLRVLFLVPTSIAKHTQPVLENDGLPYVFKPYHLHDFLEKISDLLLETGAIADPIRSMHDFGRTKRRAKTRRSARDSRRGSMFASREDYQMTEEEMAEWEHQEEEDRKKRQKELKEREHLG
jgi:CheY-like chemotaxis protein